MRNRVKLGVIGFGRLGEIHARNIAASKQAELYAIYDIDSEARERADTQYHIQAYETLDHFLSLPLDGVVIASSTAMHLAHVSAAARAGVAIFTEKPIGLTLEETDNVLNEVLSACVLFQIGFQRRWDPRYLRAKRIIDSGEIGEPVLFKAYGRDPNASNPENWGLDKNGGLFLNAAIHDYDAARFLMGKEPEKISATGAALVYDRLGQVGDIDTCSTTMFLEGKAMAITEWSRYASYGYDIGAEVVGTDGVVRIGYQQTSSVSVLHKNHKAPSVFSVFADAYEAEIEGFISSLKHSLPTTPGIEDARIALRLALWARESSKAGGKLIATPTLEPLKKAIQ